MLEQDAEPLHMVESTAFRVGHQIAQALGHAVQAELAQTVDRRMLRRERRSPLNGSSGNRGYGCKIGELSAVRVVVLVSSRCSRMEATLCSTERADLDRADGDRLRSDDINAAIEAQDAEASVRCLLRMWLAGSAPAMISASVL